MNKIIGIVAVTLVVLAGCGKQEQEVVVRFGVRGTEVVGTKSPVDGILPAAGQTLFLVEGLGVSRQVKIGDWISLKEGDYEVTGEYAPWLSGISFGGHRASARPGFLVADVMTVEQGMTEVSVDAEWSCWALCYLESEVSGARFDGADVVPEAFSDGYIGFFVEACQGSAWELELTPRDGANKKVTTFSMEADERQRAGKWYIYSPSGRVTVGAGFAINLPVWEAGN